MAEIVRITNWRPYRQDQGWDSEDCQLYAIVQGENKRFQVIKFRDLGEYALIMGRDQSFDGDFHDWRFETFEELQQWLIGW